MKLRFLIAEVVNFKELMKLNRMTLPKIMCNTIFNHDVEDISNIRKNADNLINNDSFETLPLQQVRVKDIVPTQRALNIDNLKKVKDTNKNTGAYLLEKAGKYYVLDGHHRIAINILNGNDVVSAHVYREKQ